MRLVCGTGMRIGGLVVLLVLSLPGLHASEQQQVPATRNIWEQGPPGTSSDRAKTGAGPGVRPQAPVSEFYPDYTVPGMVSDPGRTTIPPGPTVPQETARETLLMDTVPYPPGAAPLMSEQSDVPAQVLTDEKLEAVLPLSRRQDSKEQGSRDTGKRLGNSGSQLGLTVVVLAGVLALIVFLARIVRPHLPAATQSLSSEVLELLGRRMIDQRHAIHFLRIGERILIVGASLDGLRTLAEVTDPVEVDRISGVCRTRTESTVSQSFRMLLSRQERGQGGVNLDERHRLRQRQRQPAHAARESSFSWTTPDGSGDAGISSADIAELTRTLEAARERQA